MLHYPIIERSECDAGPPDPIHHLRQADLARLFGSREKAEALVTMAYLAFDLMLRECDEITELRKVWPGRSN